MRFCMKRAQTIFFSINMVVAGFACTAEQPQGDVGLADGGVATNTQALSAKLERNCVELRIPVDVPGLADVTIFARRSTNAALPPPRTVQFLVHGSTHTNDHADWPEQPERHCYGMPRTWQRPCDLSQPGSGRGAAFFTVRRALSLAHRRCSTARPPSARRGPPGYPR